MAKNWDYAELMYDFIDDEPWSTVAYREDFKSRDEVVKKVEGTLDAAGGGSCVIAWFSEEDEELYEETVEA